MKISKGWIGKACGSLLCLALLTAAGCESMDKATIGGLSGAGIGALAGQMVGGNTAATLIGAGVGAGLGYIIGNEMDKEDAKKRQPPAATQQEMEPFANTVWTVLSVNPQPKKPFTSLTVRFNPNGTVTTTRTYADGKAETDTESYRVVGSTLIVNNPDYVINARFKIEGNRAYFDTGKFSVVMQRI
jgi:hypothetical protein